MLKNDPSSAFDFSSLVELMDLDKEVLPLLQYPPRRKVKEEYSNFKKSASRYLLKPDKYIDNGGRVKQLVVYGDMIKNALAEGSNCISIYIPLQRAMVRLGIEAITESMGSRLKLQYQVNMNIETLL